MDEGFKPVPWTFGQYFANREGTVVNCHGRPIRPVKTSLGEIYTLHVNGQLKTMTIDEVLINTFGGDLIDPS